MSLHENEDEYSTFVLGKEIRFDPPSLNTFFGADLPHSVECFYDCHKDKELPFTAMSEVLCDGKAEWNVNPPVPGKVRYLERSSLNPKAKMWSAFLLGVLLPILHSNTLTKRRLWCLYALMKKEPIDVGLLVAKEMIEARATKNISLPYGKIISMLCHKAGINLKFFQRSLGKGDINSSYFNQYIFGVPSRKPKPPVATLTSEPSSSRNPEILPEPWERLEKKVDNCQADLRRIEENLAKQNEHIQALHADVQRCLQLEPLLKAIGVSLGLDVNTLMVSASVRIEAVTPEPPEDELMDETPVEAGQTVESVEEEVVTLSAPLTEEQAKTGVPVDVQEDVLLREHIENVVKETVVALASEEPHFIDRLADPPVTEALDLLANTSIADVPDSKKRKREEDDPSAS